MTELVTKGRHGLGPSFQNVGGTARIDSTERNTTVGWSPLVQLLIAAKVMLERPQLWERRELFLKARRKLRQGSGIGPWHRCEAVVPGEATSLNGAPNQYSVRIGMRSRLAMQDIPRSIIAEAAEALGGARHWEDQAVFLEQLCHGFFGTESNLIGWISFQSARVPQSRRSDEDPSVRISPHQALGMACVEPQVFSPLAEVVINDVSLVLDAVQFEGFRNLSSVRLRSVLFPKMVTRNALSGALNEWWYVPRLGPSDRDTLLNRKIPVLVDQGFYESGASTTVATTALLNLVKLTADQRAMDCTVEIHPSSGRVLSIRGYDTTLPFLLIAASAVEERVLTEALVQLAE